MSALWLGNREQLRLLTRRTGTSWVWKRLICTHSWYIWSCDVGVVTIKVADADGAGSTASTDRRIWVAGNVTRVVSVCNSNLAWEFVARSCDNLGDSNLNDQKDWKFGSTQEHVREQSIQVMRMFKRQLVMWLLFAGYYGGSPGADAIGFSWEICFPCFFSPIFLARGPPDQYLDMWSVLLLWWDIQVIHERIERVFENLKDSAPISGEVHSPFRVNFVAWHISDPFAKASVFWTHLVAVEYIQIKTELFWKRMIHKVKVELSTRKLLEICQTLIFKHTLGQVKCLRLELTETTANDPGQPSKGCLNAFVFLRNLLPFSDTTVCSYTLSTFSGDLILVFRLLCWYFRVARTVAGHLNDYNLIAPSYLL